jgi:hypothetical protein
LHRVLQQQFCKVAFLSFLKKICTVCNLLQRIGLQICKILQIFMSKEVSSGLVSGRIRIIIFNWVRNGVQNLETWIRSKKIMRFRSGSTTLVLSFQDSVRVQGAHTRRAVGSGAPSEDSQLPLLYGGLINISFSSYKFSVLECFYILGSKCLSAYLCERKLFDLCNIYVKYSCAVVYYLFY